MKTLAQRTAELRPGLAISALRSAMPLAIGIGIAFLLQAVLAPAVGPFFAKLILDIGIAILLSVSLNIVNGFAGQFSLGHGGFMLVGGYTAAWITYYGSIAIWGSPQIHGGFMGSGDLFFLAACLIGGVAAAGAGLLVGLPSLRLRGDYLAIVTLGFGEIMRVLIQRTGDVLYPDEAKKVGLLGSMDNLGGSLGFTDVPQYVSPTPWLEQTGHAGIFFAYIFVAILLVVSFRLKTSSQGRALLAVRENEIAAEAMGVVTARAKISAFVIAAFFAGVAGGLFGHQSTLSPSELGFQKSIDVVIMVVLGGMGSISGAVLAAILLTLMPEIFREFSQYRMIVYAVALVLIMIARPQGLFGTKEIWQTAWWQRLFGGLAKK
jgi:branched-chain amino acid transport system permease protein